MTARALVYSVLKANMPVDIDVIQYSRQIDPPTKSTVMVRIDRVQPSPAASGMRDYRFGLVLIAAKQAAGPGDDELENLLEDVLFVLDEIGPQGVTWESAERATYNESNPAFEVAVSVTVAKE